MSWHFSLAVEAEFSRQNCSDTISFAESNSIPLAHDDLCSDKMKGTFHRSQYGTMFVPLTDARGAELLTSFLEVSRARTLALPVKKPELQESEAGYGSNKKESFPKLIRILLSSKIALDSSSTDLSKFCAILPNWGSMRSGVLSEQIAPQLAHPISESVHGYSLPTPSGCRSGRNHVAGRLDEWGGSGNPWRGTSIGKLHCPEFEEWLMGWPEGWTGQTPLETDRFLEWQRMHSPNY